MCGRYTLRTPLHQILRQFGVPDDPGLELFPRYNIAPSQSIAAVRLDPQQDRRELVTLRWGLVPPWADDLKFGYKTINARAETVAQKPAFRKAFTDRRCLVVADGFYEWKKLPDGAKQPHFIHRRDDQPFALAGLWECWRGKDQTVESATIIVTEPNPLLATIHDRMPVILEADQYDRWLDPEFADKQSLQAMLRPYDSDDLEAYPVSTVVNKPQNDRPECVEPAAK